MIDDTRLTHSVFGTPGGERLVVLVGTGIAVTADPLPAETASRNVCVLAVALERAALEDPGTFGSETPAEQTAALLADLIRDSLATARSRLERGRTADGGAHRVPRRGRRRPACGCPTRRHDRPAWPSWPWPHPPNRSTGTTWVR